MMKLFSRLLCYTALVCGLSYGLIASTIWLVTPGSAHNAPAKAAPIPPRIAESIERKKQAPVPVPVEVVRAASPAPAAVLQEANVVLVQTPPRIRELSPPRKSKQRKPTPQPAQSQSFASSAAVTTARSDTPF